MTHERTIPLRLYSVTVRIWFPIGLHCWKRKDMIIANYFKEQIEGGATDEFFYGTEIDGTLRLLRHRGPIQTLSLNGLVFDRMHGSTPMFRPANRDNVLTAEQSKERRENRKEIMRNMGYSRVGRNNV